VLYLSVTMIKCIEKIILIIVLCQELMSTSSLSILRSKSYHHHRCSSSNGYGNGACSSSALLCSSSSSSSSSSYNNSNNNNNNNNNNNDNNPYARYKLTSMGNGNPIHYSCYFTGDDNDDSSGSSSNIDNLRTINTPITSIRQVLMKWNNSPKNILLLSKLDFEALEAQKDALEILLRKGLHVYIEKNVYKRIEEHGYDIIDDLTKDALEEGFEIDDVNIKSFDKDGVNDPIDLVVALGGDGLLMYTNTLFKGKSIPPIICFDFGSLGFLAPFAYENFEKEIDRVLYDTFPLTLRMRLQGTVYKNGETKPNGIYHILNEAVIDRGPSPFLAMVDVECDQQYLTTVQGDGIIIATPTGSTAYSLAAGGSMVHPTVPAILLTPICAHSLSFRPLLLPDSSTLVCQVPFDSRASAWVSFDGKFRQELHRGDRLEIKMSRYPMPTVNRMNFTGDWFESLRSSFMFNLRPRQRGGQ